MKGSEFEKICLYRMQAEETLGVATMSRYGVQGVFAKPKEGGKPEWRPVRSLPDFEGVFASGVQFILDAKVCSGASLDLHPSKTAARQITHMLRRSRFGVICALLIHLPKRELKTRKDPQRTVAFPVLSGHPFWQAYERAEIKTISRQDMDEYGVQVAWNTLPGGRTARPDIVSALRRLIEKVAS